MNDTSMDGTCGTQSNGTLKITGLATAIWIDRINS